MSMAYDNGAIQTWSSNEPPYYLGYPSTSLSNLNELTLLQSQPTDQIHLWQDNATGGTTCIQYLGKCFFCLY